MEIHTGELTDVNRYLDNRKQLKPEDYQPYLENCLGWIQKYRPLPRGSKLLEIGTGSGFFPVLCGMRGMDCIGLEISPRLIEEARELGKQYGVAVDIRLANIETADLGENLFDAVLACSVFEHVEDWRAGVRNVYRLLKPGGAMFFESTNKFSFKSGEYTGVPLYGWLPDGARYALRKRVHGPDIMKLGIDFHQFRSSLLRREFKKIGFSQVHDAVDLVDLEKKPAGLKRNLFALAKTNPAFHWLMLTFSEATRFVVVK